MAFPVSHHVAPYTMFPASKLDHRFDLGGITRMVCASLRSGTGVASFVKRVRCAVSLIGNWHQVTNILCFLNVFGFWTSPGLGALVPTGHISLNSTLFGNLKPISMFRFSLLQLRHTHHQHPIYLYPGALNTVPPCKSVRLLVALNLVQFLLVQFANFGRLRLNFIK